MKQKSMAIVVAVGFLGISGLCFLYYALLNYPALSLLFFGRSISYNASYVIQWGYVLLRLGLCIAFGWCLATYRYKGLAMHKQHAFSRFAKRNRGALILVVALFFIHNTHNPIRDSVLPDLWVFFWDLFVNPGGWTAETYIVPGEKWVTAPSFIYETFLAQFAHYTIMAAYLAYKFRAALCAPDTHNYMGGT